MQQVSDGRSFPVQRKHRRYDLQCPVRLQLPQMPSVSSLDTVSRNVSLGGMLVDSKIPVPKDSPVFLTMTLGGQPMIRTLQITAEGRVVRVTEDESGFAIAVEFTRPLSQIENLLTTSELSF
jgi:hypothetical protein